MKIFAAALLLVLTAAPVMAAPLPVSCAAPRAAFTVRDGVLVAFSGQADEAGQPGVSGRDEGGRNKANGGGSGQDGSSDRSDRVIIKGKGGKVTGVERTPGPGGKRDTGGPPRQ